MAWAARRGEEEEKKTGTAPIGTATTSWAWPGLLLLLVVVPVAVSVAIYRAEEFDPAHLPDDCTSASLSVANHNTRALQDTERVGEGLLLGPEDLAHDAVGGILYTSCIDGWIRRIRLEEAAAVEDWAYVGGRPLGIAFGGPDRKTLVVANADRGLLAVRADGSVDPLADEAEGVEFGLTDGVDVASDGRIYFTDASYKYNLRMHMMDVVEGRPYGRLMRFDPVTNRTEVLVRDLYFANGVVVSPDQEFVIFCETVLRRCQRYYIEGEKKGSVDMFIKNLPGFPDNIRYDGEGHYWIALASRKTIVWQVVFKYPFVRKLLVLLGKYVKIPNFQRDGGVLGVNLYGEPFVLHTDPGLKEITSGLKIGRHLYFGSLHDPYISRIDLEKHAAHELQIE